MFARKNQEKENKFMDQNTYLNIDKALEFVGDNSNFQKRIIYIFAAQWMLFSFLIMGMPVLFSPPSFICPQVDELTGEVTNVYCSETAACQNYKETFMIDKESSNSIAREFQLYCDRKYLVGLSGSVFFLGATIAGFFLPQYAQIKGRKEAIHLAIVIAGVSITLAGLSRNIFQFMFFLFTSGIGLNGFETLSLVYVSEISAEQFRTVSSVILMASWSIGQIIYSQLSSLILNWRFICIGLIGIPFIISIYFSRKYLLETPRWLVSKKRFQEAKEVLSEISTLNDRPKVRFMIEGEEKSLFDYNQTNDGERKTNLLEKQQKNHTQIDLFRYPSTRFLTIIMITLWVFRYCTYYAQAFSITSIGNNVQRVMLMIAISELVASLVSGPVKLKLKRIFTMALFASVCSGCCILIFLIKRPEACYQDQCYQEGFLYMISMIIKFSISLFAGILITYTSEVFPTEVRSLAYGLCMTCGKAGTIFMPLIVSSFQLEGVNPLILFGFFGLIVVALLTKFLEETKDRPLQDFIQETQDNEKPMIQLEEFDADLNQKFLQK